MKIREKQVAKDSEKVQREKEKFLKHIERLYSVMEERKEFPSLNSL